MNTITLYDGGVLLLHWRHASILDDTEHTAGVVSLIVLILMVWRVRRKVGGAYDKILVT